jgi:hypothetical protein
MNHIFIADILYRVLSFYTPFITLHSFVTAIFYIYVRERSQTDFIRIIIRIIMAEVVRNFRQRYYPIDR